MKLSIIIVSYNVSYYIRQCIHSIINSDIDCEYEIIVVDNFSFDNTVEILKKDFGDLKNFKLIKNNSNYGFSKAINQGIVESNGKYVCILNPDTIVNNDSIKILLDYLSKNKNVGCIGPKILNPDGSFQLSSKRKFPNLSSSFFKLFGMSYFFPKSRIINSYNMYSFDENNIHEVDCISGSFMLMPSRIIESVGLFDEKFFMHAEDIDYCFRIKELGYDVIYNPNSKIIHYKGRSKLKAPFDLVKIFYDSIKTFFLKYKNKNIIWSSLSPLIIVVIEARRLLSYSGIVFKKFQFILLDLLFLISTFTVSHKFWFDTYYGEILTFDDLNKFIPSLFIILISWVLSINIIKFNRSSFFSLSKMNFSILLSFIISSTLIYFIGYYAHSRMSLLLTFALFCMVGTFVRMILFFISSRKRFGELNRDFLFYKNVLIIGTNEESIRVSQLILDLPYLNYNFLGFVSNEKSSLSNNKVLGRINYLESLIIKYKINEIVIPENNLKISALIDLIEKAKGIAIKIVPKGKEIMIGSEFIESLDRLAFPLIRFSSIKNRFIIKRFIDILISFFIILISIPIHIVYLFINRKIYYIKILNNKNMKIDIMKYDSQNRIIRELPIFFYILNGTLSFVGSEIVQSTHPRQGNNNSIVKPGITGISHIKRRNSGDTNINVKFFDTYYINNQSFLLDLAILIKTVVKI